jgi:hypothetical protein
MTFPGRPLPVSTKLRHGESPRSYARRLAAHNALTVDELAHHLDHPGTITSWSNPRLLKVLRQAGGLPAVAFTEPRQRDGNWISERLFCPQCCHGERAWGRRPDIGYFCTRHHRWMPDAHTSLLLPHNRPAASSAGEPGSVEGPHSPTGPDLTAAAHRAERRYRSVLHPRAEFLDAYAMRFALTLAALLLPPDQWSQPDTPAVLYVRQVEVACQLTQVDTLTALADPATPHTDRVHVIRGIAETAAGARHPAPDKLDTARIDGWVAENRLWALSASLQSVMRGGRLSRDVVADPDHNLLRHLIWPR